MKRPTMKIIPVQEYNRSRPFFHRFTWNGVDRKRGYVLCIFYAEGGVGYHFYPTRKEAQYRAEIQGVVT